MLDERQALLKNPHQNAAMRVRVFGKLQSQSFHVGLERRDIRLVFDCVERRSNLLEGLSLVATLLGKDRGHFGRQNGHQWREEIVE